MPGSAVAGPYLSVHGHEGNEISLTEERGKRTSVDVIQVLQVLHARA
jgi:hypothetical protein